MTTIDIKAMLDKTIEKTKAIGAAIGFIDQGKLHFYCSGSKAAPDNIPISIDTIFEIGSITKVFTTLILVEMTQQTEVSLDDRVDTLLPSVRIPEFKGKKITLRHLAAHHSGLPSIPTNFNPSNLMNPYADYSIKALYQFLNHHTLKHPPGEHFEYSNVGMSLLGHILCMRAKKTFGQLISDIILQPLSMDSTGIELNQKMRAQMSVGHHLGRRALCWNIPAAILGAGGILASIKDMTQFLAANLGIISSPVTAHLKQCHKRQYTPNPTESIGLGWIISHSENADIIWHDGITGGFRSFIGFNPKNNKGIVVLANSTAEWPNDFSFSLLKS